MNEEEVILISPRQIANAISDLIDENEDLQQRINKAIEYATDEMRIVNDNEYHRLIEILKGE